MNWIKAIITTLSHNHSVKIEGYKATNPDMTCRRYQFGIGKFHHKGRVVPCNSGFHFCENMEDVFKYYDTDCRIFEVIGSGEIIHKDDKIVCSDIEFVKEIDYETLVDSKSVGLRAVCARNGYHHDTLINDEWYHVRACIAHSATDDDILTKLSLDRHANVRFALVTAGKKLDVLVNDHSTMIRMEVARQGYGLDTLINDPDWLVRRTVAEMGYGLDKLVYDPNNMVRLEVVKHGYGFDILANDPDPTIRSKCCSTIGM